MLKPLSEHVAARFTGVLRATGYTTEILESQLGIRVAPPPHHPQFSIFLQQTQELTPFNLLARLFFLGTPVSAEAMRAMHSNWLLDICLESQLLQVENDLLQPRVLIVPCGGFWVAADLHLQGDAVDDDYILSVNQPSLHLLNFTIRRPVQATLDLCSGSGLHGMDASRFSQSVVASDLCERAAVFGRFNAALNACPNMKFISGDLFSSVEGQEFDLIVSNPPFIISPRTTTSYRDNPLELDNFVRLLLNQAPHYLREGSFLQVICEWVETKGEDWQERLRNWLRPTGCDAWVLQANRQLPETYARGKLRESHAEPQRLEELCQQWLAYFQQHDVEAIYGGLIFLRRRAGENWFAESQLASHVGRAVGDAILQGFRNRDLVHSGQGEAALLNSCLRVADGLILEEKSHWESAAWRSDSLVLRIERGLPATIGIDANVKRLLQTFDGQRSVAHVLDAFAAQVHLPAGELREKCLELVRMLLESGGLLA